MGAGYLIDSNVVIEFLGGSLPSSSSMFIENVIYQNLHYLSVINKIEILGFKGSTSELNLLEEFINESNLIPLSEDVVRMTILLRKTLRIKLPDAIIAASALSNDLILLTRNTKDFKNVEALVCLDSHKLK